MCLKRGSVYDLTQRRYSANSNSLALCLCDELFGGWRVLGFSIISYSDLLAPPECVEREDVTFPGSWTDHLVGKKAQSRPSPGVTWLSSAGSPLAKTFSPGLQVVVSFVIANVDSPNSYWVLKAEFKAPHINLLGKYNNYYLHPTGEETEVQGRSK